LSGGANSVTDAIKGDPNYSVLGHMKDDVEELRGLIKHY
jgi:hypothetical protein